MREYMEVWKVLILCCEVFCGAGVLFTDKRTLSHKVLYVLFMLFAMTYICVV